MPIMGKCIECGNELLQTVTKGSVEKYVSIAINLCNQFKINDYLRSRVESLTMEYKIHNEESIQGLKNEIQKDLPDNL